MAKRGKRATKVKAPSERTRQDIRRILRKAGSLDRYCQWGREEQEAIEREKAQEDFDNAFLPGLAFMDENFWKHERSPEAKRSFRRRAREQGRQEKLLTREEIIDATMKAFWENPKASDLDLIEDDAVRAAWKNSKLSMGQSPKAAARRLIRKLREGKSKPPR
jgi:hypothetical protein